MESLLATYVTGQVATFMMVFARMGTAIMVMPGIGDSFVSSRVRLLFAFAFVAVITPMISPLVPDLNMNSPVFLWVMVRELVIGFFIGTVARIFMTALDTGGMIISMQTGLGNAMVFNPQMAGQGSIIGAFLSITGAVLLFSTNLHHLLIYALVDSYKTFAMGADFPLVEGMAQTIAKAVAQSFQIGFYMAVPFMMVSLLLYICMGVLGRLMPQIQVFILALPIQILLGFLTLFTVTSTVLLYWIGEYDSAIRMFFSDMGGIDG
ncbi:MAG: flagellar biosynthetic protein FliR [Alphaproteobacteria bacterium]|nr:MAG: flagellar biosynthetic protein FliR [Alphaproteobacteria bacterium]